MDYEVVDRATVKWWEELERHKKDNWCCSTLKEGAFEEHLKLEFDYILPVRFGVYFCCQCGNPIREGYKKSDGAQEDWCCRLMHAVGFEWLEFKSAGNDISTIRVKHCFHCGREIKPPAQKKEER